MAFNYSSIEEETPKAPMGISDVLLTPIFTLGHILDTPASMIRGVLAGKDMEDILNGIWDIDKRATGREVLENILPRLGIDPEAGKIGSFDISGLGVEIGLDPILALGSVTGLTKAGRAAKTLSKVSKTAERTGQILKNVAISSKIGDAATILKTAPEAFHTLGPEIVGKVAREAPEVWKTFSTSVKRGRTLAEEAAQQNVPAGMTRLFRGETSLGEQLEKHPEWLQKLLEDTGYSPEVGRWFTEDLQKAKQYAVAKFGTREAGVGRKLSSIDIPTSEIEKFRVSNIAKVFDQSTDPTKEFFLSKELAATRKPIDAATLGLKKTVGEQIAAGERGLSLSAPWGKSEFVPTELNKFLSPAIELANKGWGKVVQGAGVLTKPFKKAFSTAKLTEPGQFFGKDALGRAENQVALEAEKNTARLNREWERISKATGLSAEEIDTQVHRTIEYALTPEKVRLNVKSQIDQISENLKNSLTQADRMHEVRLGEISRPLTFLQNAKSLDSDALPAFFADFEKEFGMDIRGKSLDQTIQNYQDAAKELGKKTAAKKKGLTTRAMNNVSEWKIRETEALSKAATAAGFIGPDGSLPKSLTDSIRAGLEDVGRIQKQNSLVASLLNDPFVDYFPHVLSPEGKMLYERNEAFRKYFDSEFNVRLQSSKKRKLDEMGLEEVNQYLKERFKIDINVFDVDVRRALNTYHRKASSAIAQGRLINAAIQFTAEEAQSPGAVHIVELLTKSGMHGFLPQGSEEAISWGLKSTPDQVKKLLKSSGIKNVWIPKNVATDLLTNQSMYTIGDLENVFRLIDPINTWYRSMLTAVPAFTGTNVVGNAWAMSYRGFLPFTPSGAKNLFKAGQDLAKSYFERNPDSIARKLFLGIEKEIPKDAVWNMRFLEFEKRGKSFTAAFKLKNGTIRETGAVHQLPIDFDLKQIAEEGFTYKGKFLTRAEVAKFGRGSFSEEMKHVLDEPLFYTHRDMIEFEAKRGNIGEGIKDHPDLIKKYGLRKSGELLSRTERKELETAMVFAGVNQNRIAEIEQMLMGREGGKFTKFFAGQLTGKETNWLARKGSGGFKGVREFNNFLEDAMKIALFRHEVDRGADFVEAGRTVKKYLFDYTDLTGFEKKVMRRLVLFYTFARKNFPLAISETVMNRQAYMAAKAPLMLAKTEDFVPDYILDQGNIRVGPGHYIDLKQPFFEANRFAPQRGGIQRVFDKILTQLVPQFKVPLEFVSGREFFRGVPLETVNRIPDYMSFLPTAKKIETKRGVETRAPGWLAETLRNVPWTRQEQIIKDLSDTEKEIRPITSLFGLRERQIDPQKLKLQATIKNIKSILANDPAVREFGRYFSIEKEPNKKVKALEEQLKRVNESYYSK